MREIKFRGFSKTLNKWIIGVAYFREGNWWILVDENTKSDDIGTGSYFVDKNSISQYTGLKDKNGVEIYEGDFIKVLGNKCTVFWQQGAFKFQNISNYNIQPLFDFATINKCVAYEVIGNIYENQEMLELE